MWKKRDSNHAISSSTDSKQHDKRDGISPQRAYLVETSLYIDDF